jgi:hypothetical protein
MSGPIKFTGNYEDLSTDRGFQFKFYCELCGNGYMSSFKANKLGTAESVLRGASNLFGGILGRVADASTEVNRLVGGPAHDRALAEAGEEISPRFLQCKRCGQYRCQEICWNQDVGLCKSCAPIAETEEASIRAQHVSTQVQNDLFLEENERMSKKATVVAAKCPHCGGKTGGKKFCPECGKPTNAEAKICPQCGKRADPGAKFCGDCGGKL